MFSSKSFLRILVLLFFAVLSGCNTEDQGRVTAVTASVDNATFTGTCPHDFVFSGLISTNVAGRINFIWEKSTGNGMPDSVDLPVAGAVVVQDTIRVTASGSVSAKVHVTSPNDITSNTVTATATCQ